MSEQTSIGVERCTPENFEIRRRCFAPAVWKRHATPCRYTPVNLLNWLAVSRFAFTLVNRSFTFVNSLLWVHLPEIHR